VFLVLALVSRIVGAVGIANVTLVTVMERTAEIGLRRSLGAARGRFRRPVPALRAARLQPVDALRSGT